MGATTEPESDLLSAEKDTRDVPLRVLSTRPSPSLRLIGVGNPARPDKAAFQSSI